jgi:hypothetical protein
MRIDNPLNPDSLAAFSVSPYRNSPYAILFPTSTYAPLPRLRATC